MSIKRYSCWWDSSPPDFAYQAQLPVYADVVIIGAGFAGVSTAFWILKLATKGNKPFRILILEEGPHAAFKATGRMNGSIYLGSNKPVSEVADQLTESVTHKLYKYSSINNQILKQNLHRADCGFEFNGGLRMSNTIKETGELQKSRELLEKWGFHSVYFDNNKSQHVVITPLIKGSLFLPHEGMFNPFKFTNEMARSLRNHHVWISYGSRAISTSQDDNGPYVTLDNGHIIHASKIIHTTSRTVPWERIQESIVHVRETVARTNPLAEELDDMPLPLMPIEINRGLDSVRINDRAVIMTGGKSSLRKDDPEVGVLDDSGIHQRILDHLDSTMMRNFPFSNHTEISHAWTYIETSSVDGLPFAGELPDFPNQYVNIAHGRNKFGLAFLTSKNVAERVLRIKVPESEFSIFTPRRLLKGEQDV